MQIYSVGGFVRDTLLKRRGFPATPGDHDWVVVGETPESMIERGFLPVGEDFPVFLHPKTHEEYALARTERKTAPGYHGFVFHASADVTLEEDLRRRDLTINAIAMDENGSLCDPYGGAEDIARGIIRHVSEAFKEDPVRILRVSRFAARFPGFSIAPETMTLMREMVNSGEADALVPERVLAEFVKGLSTLSKRDAHQRRSSPPSQDLPRSAPHFSTACCACFRPAGRQAGKRLSFPPARKCRSTGSGQNPWRLNAGARRALNP